MMAKLKELREALLQGFAEHVANLRAQAGNDPSSQASLRALEEIEVRVMFRLGAEELHLCLRNATLTADDRSAPCLLAVGVPAQVAPWMIESLLETTRQRRQAGSWPVPDREKLALVFATPLRAHLVLSGVPEVGELRIAVGLACDEPPDRPDFEVHLAFDALEALSEGRASVQEAMMNGMIRLDGDYGPALQLVLQLAQS